MSEIERRFYTPDGRLDVDGLQEDLRPIVAALFDLAHYRTVPIADDLARAVAHELQDRVSKLPEVRAL